MARAAPRQSRPARRPEGRARPERVAAARPAISPKGVQALPSLDFCVPVVGGLTGRLARKGRHLRGVGSVFGYGQWRAVAVHNGPAATSAPMSIVSEREKGPTGLTRFVPILSWLPQYQRSWLPNDAVAGFTIWGLLIPEMIAYASLAGLSPQAGLYTLLASLALYAIFGTSRHLVVAATSASAVLIYSAVTTAALSPDAVHGYATLAAGMILITGLFFVVAGICRLGFITSFLSRPVMEGFVFGLAIFVTISQLPKLFGLKKGSGDSVRQLAHLIAHLGDTSLTTLAIGLLALVLLFGIERYAPRIPGRAGRPCRRHRPFGRAKPFSPRR